MIETIHQQYAEGVSTLWGQRDYAVRAPHYDFDDLLRHDERLAAHLDGLLVAGAAGAEIAVAEFEDFPLAGSAFAVAWLALESGDRAGFERLVDAVAGMEAEEPPEPPGAELAADHTLRRGVASAMGWVAPERLAGVVRDYLSADEGLRRWLGVAACALHRRDPGPALAGCLTDQDPAVTARAAKAAGELGRRDLIGPMVERTSDPDLSIAFWCAWSGSLLGGGDAFTRALAGFVTPHGRHSALAAYSYTRLAPPAGVRADFARWRNDAALRRRLIQAVGAFGDPAFLPWLVEEASNVEQARIAGEAIAMISGLDLANEKLDADGPPEFEPGPNDDLEDPDVALDPDEDLPWPDPDAIAKRLSAVELLSGNRHLAGQPLCAVRSVLATGFQRQRLAAALEIARMSASGETLFPCAATARRQKAMLDAFKP